MKTIKSEKIRKRYRIGYFKKVQGIGKEVVPTVVIDLVDQLKGNYYSDARSIKYT